MLKRNQCVVAVYESPAQTRLGIDRLLYAGFTLDDFSIVTRQQDPAGDAAETVALSDDSLSSAAGGGALGALAGVVGAVTLIPIAGAAVLLAGPIMAATGAIVGALVGAMKGWGIRDDTIEHYETTIREGKVMLVVVGDPQRLHEAQEILDNTDATEVTLHTQGSDDSPEVDDRSDPPLVGRSSRTKH